MRWSFDLELYPVRRNNWLWWRKICGADPQGSLILNVIAAVKLLFQDATTSQAGERKREEKWKGRRKGEEKGDKWIWEEWLYAKMGLSEYVTKLINVDL